MKFDITIPGPVFYTAQNLAAKMGISLSELFVVALNAYMTEHGEGNITDVLNQIYDEEESILEPELVKMQIISLEGG